MHVDIISFALSLQMYNSILSLPFISKFIYLCSQNGIVSEVSSHQSPVKCKRKRSSVYQAIQITHNFLFQDRQSESHIDRFSGSEGSRFNPHRNQENNFNILNYCSSPQPVCIIRKAILLTGFSPPRLKQSVIVHSIYPPTFSYNPNCICLFRQRPCINRLSICQFRMFLFCDITSR